MAHETTSHTFAAPSPAAHDQIVSFADYAASTVADPQPAWRTLNAARERAFTGEIRFDTTPAVLAYVDGGSVYYAERTGAASLGQRLVAAGVLTPQQLDRGTVRVGDGEHLGRLFDRDETIDRDAVMVVVESDTDAIVAELAADVVATVSVSAYRHHQSGVHRWFVAPADAALSRPVSDVAQVDRSVIDELPDVRTAPDITIEWDHPAPAPTNSTPLVAPSPLANDATADRFDAEWPSDEQRDAPVAAAAERDEESWLGEFQIVWPDGTEEAATPASSPRPTTDPSDAASLDKPRPVASTDSPSTGSPRAPQPSVASAAPTPAPAAAVGLDAPAELAPPSTAPVGEPTNDVHFAMPQIVVESAPLPDEAVPDDVASAVRRALQAIENAAIEPASLRAIDLEPLAIPDFDVSHRITEPVTPEAPPTPDVTEPIDEAPTVDPVVDTAVLPAPHVPPPMAPLAQPAAVAKSTFAPPSADMRAEAIYARAASVATSVERTTDLAEAAPIDDPAAEPVALPPEPGQASVVFVDEADDGGSSRKGALRRLIGSLRKTS